MIKIENVETYGWKSAIRGMRNPLNSWDKSDTIYCDELGCGACQYRETECQDREFIYDALDFSIGNSDKKLMMNLNKSPEESKYRRMITVTFDTVAPLYFYKEMDTYKIGTVCNSCSTMHKIHSKEFEVEDFSHEHLNGYSLAFLYEIIDELNYNRELFIDNNNKDYWWQMIQLLPSSYNQRRTYQMNYEVLASIYRQRKNHKLDEWREFCKWIESLPYSELIR